MASSDLTSSISSALTHLDLSERGLFPAACHLELKMELRIVKMQLVIWLRKMGDDLPSRLSEIEGAVGRILLKDIPFSSTDTSFKEWLYLEALPELRGFSKQLADECSTSSLGVDDVSKITDSILDNLGDFWRLAYGCNLKLDVIDSFVAQLTFLKGTLVFAEGTGVELQHLMIHFQPFAIYAARVFMEEDRVNKVSDYYQEFHSKCEVAIGIATTPQVYEAYTQVLNTCAFSSATAGILGNFLDSLISLLWDFLRHHSNSRIKDLLKGLYERLRFCRSLLKRKPGCFDGDQIGVLICGAGILVCSLNHTHLELSYPDQLQELLGRFDVLQAHVENNASESMSPATNEMDSGDSAYMVENMVVSDVNEETTMPSHQPQKISADGFQDDEVNPVLDRLTRGSKQLQIVPICGMAGLGKTTFASALYNHPFIIYHFQSRAWCPISQVLDKRRVMLQLLNQLNQESGSCSDMTEDDIANELRRSLKGKRYLIVLDDVWTTEAWISLAASFPDDATQSRIIFTSRYRDVVPDQQPYLLRLRDDNECLEILKRKLSNNRGWTSDFGMTIAKICKGLPLTAVIVAGLLVGTANQQSWKGILDHLSSSGVSGEKQCNNALELSFKHLPDDLKPCFLYFAVFPEDEEISVKRLLRLWMGEGFVREGESKRIEDVAQEYMENLIQGSLVMVAQNRSIGGVKTCRIHDLMHSFCLRKAKQENLFHILSQKDDELSYFNEPSNMQRLIIHSNTIHFKDARLFCPGAHSMFLFSTAKLDFFDVLFIIQIFKFLHVLDLHGSSFTTEIPTEIELLTQLRYLSIRSNMSVIPSSLGNLPNLETFIGEFKASRILPFPHTFWNLHKLKCLYIKGLGFSLPTESIDKSCALLELETLCGVVFKYFSMDQQMRKFPNIRRLKCIISGASTENSKKIVISDILNQLQSLTIFGVGPLQFEFGLSESLRKLTLWHFELSRQEIVNIGKLPNLEVLKLQGICFCDDTLDMEEEEFSNLKYLKLASIWLNRWTVSDEQLPCLKKLSFYNCDILEELPSDCLTWSATIEEIEVRRCSPNVEDFAREIQEAQEDCGNSVKVRIESRM